MTYLFNPSTSRRAILIPAVLICVAAVWFALRYVKPAPPLSFAISAASAGSPYYDLALRFKEQVEGVIMCVSCKGPSTISRSQG